MEPKNKPGPPKGYRHTPEARSKMRKKRSAEALANITAAQRARRQREKEIQSMGVL